MSAQIALRIDQGAEALFAALALIFTLSLPWPPDEATGAIWSFWAVITLLAAWLAWRLRRPTRLVWILAALLSAVILVLALYERAVIAHTFAGSSPSVTGASYALATIARAFQVIVALSLSWAWVHRADLAQGARLPPTSVPHN